MVAMAHLFVYGTLLPGEERWRFLAPVVLGHGVPDTAPGDLYDTGLGYPAARFGTAGMITGRTFTLIESSDDRALRNLDVIEGAVAGLYRRTSIVTGNGVRAWAYEYGSGLSLTRIASGSWLEAGGMAPT
jgi:gamma-glutamylcyclotransferase (GGCT)/AIG2-like uncharacterized protein YtfP